MGLGVADVSDNNREEHGQITHLLEGKVEEEDYDQAISILAESKGYKNE
ncbi:hypothetical protein [Oceanobacillus picturae]